VQGDYVGGRYNGSERQDDLFEMWVQAIGACFQPACWHKGRR
jgi:hypothetical protein